MNSISSPPTKFSSTEFFALIRNPVKFKAFLLKNLPVAYFSGLKIKSLDEESVIVSVPYKWFTRNPFNCTYFACLSMAAEMSTGILAMANTYKRSPKISMLVTEIEGKFYKRATGTALFTCEAGAAIKQTIKNTISTNEPQLIKVLSSGLNEQNELVADFWITWSFKAK